MPRSRLDLRGDFHRSGASLRNWILRDRLTGAKNTLRRCAVLPGAFSSSGNYRSDSPVQETLNPRAHRHTERALIPAIVTRPWTVSLPWTGDPTCELSEYA